MPRSEDKFILDATAGFRMMWFNKHERHTIYLDKRPQCEPDIIGDYRNLNQFPDNSFKLIVFDPQHRREQDGYPEGFRVSYGELLPETWHSEFKKAFSEMWRVLQPFGILIFKWSTHKITKEEVLGCFFVDPLFGQTTVGHSHSSKGSKTYWFCFMKIPEEAKN
jgi:hypothetical protein